MSDAAAPFDRARPVADLLAAGYAAIERMAWSTEQIRAHQSAGLRRLLAHAVASSPFHRARLGRLDVDALTLDDLGDLPTMTKRQMMTAFDEVVTDPAITRTLVDAHVARAPDEMAYLLGRYVVMASGGSSGERGLFVYDAGAFTEFTLAIVGPILARLRAFGVTPDNPIPGAIVAAGATVHGTGAVGALAGGAGAPVAMTRISAASPLAEIVGRLEAVQPLVVTAYPSVLARLAAEKAAGRLGIAPLAVGCTSEPLSTADRQAIEAAFGVPVSNTFGSSEGLCGVSEPGDDAIVFADDGCIVELVDAEHRPVSPGAPSVKVLVTNLYNWTQPLIRYELTDRFVEIAGPHADGHLRAVVEGRHDEPLRFGDVEVHPLTIRAVLVKSPEVFEYQVRQVPNGVDVSVVATGGLDADGLALDVAGALAAAGLPGAEVRVRAVDAIERDPATGKARRFIPLATSGHLVG